MRILGIHDSHDAGAAIIEDGRIIAAVNEERLNRMKLCWGFPRDSIQKVLELAELTVADIDHIAIATQHAPFHDHAYAYEETTALIDQERQIISQLSPYLGPFFRTTLWTNIQRKILASRGKERQEKIQQLLREFYGFTCGISFVEHHLAHAASAYYTSGRDDVLIVTADAAGGLSQQAYSTLAGGSWTIRIG